MLAFRQPKTETMTRAEKKAAPPRAEKGRGGQFADADDPAELLDGQGQQIDEVDQDIDDGDGQDAQGQAAGNGALRVAYLPGRAVDRVPAVVRPEDGHEGQPERLEDAGEGRSRREQGMEIHAARLDAEEDAQADKRGDGTETEYGQQVLDDGA